MISLIAGSVLFSLNFCGVNIGKNLFYDKPVTRPKAFKRSVLFTSSLNLILSRAG